jgi:hypothetical protein
MSETQHMRIGAAKSGVVEQQRRAIPPGEVLLEGEDLPAVTPRALASRDRPHPGAGESFP